MRFASALGFALLLPVVPACTGAGDFGADLDGGPEAELGDCVDAGPECVPGAPDGGADVCSSLVELACGETCLESPGCAAATLLADHEPERCAEALEDTQTFPHCELGVCDALVLRACGGDPPVDACVDAPGCAPALEMQTRARDPEATQDEIDEAKSECTAALEDEIVFAACP
jgi:hypothetical protein